LLEKGCPWDKRTSKNASAQEFPSTMMTWLINNLFTNALNIMFSVFSETEGYFLCLLLPKEPVE
jgi:hypothetical protein